MCGHLGGFDGTRTAWFQSCIGHEHQDAGAGGGGSLLERGVIGRAQVDYLFGCTVIAFWEKWNAWQFGGAGVEPPVRSARGFGLWKWRRFCSSFATGFVFRNLTADLRVLPLMVSIA